jgi:DNA-binding PadR family transcriptional regulator
VQGTLDMLLLKILALEPMNGFAVSQRLKQVSGDVLRMSDGSLCPALQKLDYSRAENARVWSADEILFAHTAGAATARKRSR